VVYFKLRWISASALGKYFKLFGSVALIFLLCHTVLPRLSKAPCLEVVRSNARLDIDATAYFYTELDDFGKYEEAVRQEPPRQE
jgi:hypothetical protein